MSKPLFSNRFFLKSMALAAVAAGLLQVGATVHVFAPVGKEDRVSSIADCRWAEGLPGDRCREIVLPRTSAEPIDVMPGLTVVEQVPG